MKILYISPVPWRWIKQRPHFTAELLAANGDDVEFLFCGPVGKCRHQSHASDGIAVRERLLLPFSLKFPLIEAANGVLARHYLHRRHYDAVVLTEPRQWHYLPTALRHSARIVYDCMDVITAFHPGKTGTRLARYERELCRNAAAIIASSDYLKQFLSTRYAVAPEQITVIRNAISQSWLRHSAAVAPVPLATPNMVYIGTLERWLDWPLLLEFARRHPETTLYLIGPTVALPGELPANIHCPGAVPHEAVYAYCRAADVLLLPFTVNELVRGVDPVKMYEYLAADKPILSAWWEELEHFAVCPGVHFYHTPGEFFACAERLRETPAGGSAPAGFLSNNTWEARIRDYREVLTPHR